MEIVGTATKVSIYIGDSDRWHGRPLSARRSCRGDFLPKPVSLALSGVAPGRCPEPTGAPPRGPTLMQQDEPFPT